MTMRYSGKQINQLVERIRSGKPPPIPEGKFDIRFYDRALPNFCIRVWRGGAVWLVQWKRFGRSKKQTIGDVLVLDRTAAIEAARDLLAKVRLEILDPHAARREAMRRARVTFEAVVEPFLNYKATHERKKLGKLRDSTMERWRRYLTGYYFQPLHKLPIDEITTPQIKACLDTIAKESGPQAASVCWIPMNVLFNWAIDPKGGYLPTDHKNPMAHVEQPPQSEPRERVLTDEEIAIMWHAVQQWEADALHDEQTKAAGGRPGRKPCLTDTPRAIQLLFLTGLRKQEIGDLQWSELDLDHGEIRIQASRTKNHAVLHNPLSPMALEILRNIKQHPNRPNVFGKSHQPGRGHQLYMHNIRYMIDPRVAAAGKPPLAPWTVHDIRRTFRTRMEQLKVPKHVAAALIGHKRASEKGAVSRIDEGYNQYDYWPEKRDALTKWEDLLQAIISGTAPKIVTPRFGQRFIKEAS